MSDEAPILFLGVKVKMRGHGIVINPPEIPEEQEEDEE